MILNGHSVLVSKSISDIKLYSRFENVCPVFALSSLANHDRTKNKRLYGATYFHKKVNLPDLPRVFLYIFLSIL